MFPGKKKYELLITGMIDGLFVVYTISTKAEKSKIINRVIKDSKLCRTVVGFYLVFGYLSCTSLKSPFRKGEYKKYGPAKPRKNWISIIFRVD